MRSERSRHARCGDHRRQRVQLVRREIRTWLPVRRSSRCACSARMAPAPLTASSTRFSGCSITPREKHPRRQSVVRHATRPGSLPDADPLASMLDKDARRSACDRDQGAGRRRDLRRRRCRQRRTGGLFDAAALDRASSRTPSAGRCDVWGGITAPGSFPWVFTVGASSSNGSFTRADDERAAFSSRGPAFPLQIAKPDILAGGVGIESTAAPGSALYRARARVANPSWLVHGAFPTAALPVPRAQRHEPGGCRRQRRRRADDPGEPAADAQLDQGHPRVHRPRITTATTRSSRAPASSTRSEPFGCLVSTRPRATVSVCRSNRFGASTSSGVITTCPAVSCCRARMPGRRGVLWGSTENGRERRRQHRVGHVVRVRRVR